MFDSDLVALPGTHEEPHLAVRRNLDRFQGLRVSAHKRRVRHLRLQFATSSSGYGAGATYPMLSPSMEWQCFPQYSKAKSQVQMSILIIRAFIQMREL